MNRPTLFPKANKAEQTCGRFANALTFKAPAVKRKTHPAPQQLSLFDGHDQAQPAPRVFHPRPRENGEKVRIHSPSAPTGQDSWTGADAVATFTPGSPVPDCLHGVPLAPWTDHPRTRQGWNQVDGQMDALGEPPLDLPMGKTAASGAIIEEPDGRIWLVHPTNGFAGYDATFPKGGAEPGLSLQANAIKECFEEAGLKVEITGMFGDFERSTTVARYYRGKRVGGTPADMGWESQAVSLVPKNRLHELLNGAADTPIAAAAGKPAGHDQARSIEGWKQVGKQHGSNPGGFFQDPTGQRWYCKFPKSADHAKNEILASKLYEALGIRTPHMELIRLNGRLGVASRMIAGLRRDEAGLRGGKVKGAAEGFAADAWLANWDAVGLLYDNMLVDEAGNAVRIDPGGALIYRAQGAPKGQAFGDKVAELETLRFGQNVEAAAVFGQISKAQIARGVAQIAALPDKRIRAIVQEHGPGTAGQRQELAERLIRRKADLMHSLAEDQ
ncbi:NUDIX hydrolase [Geminicoccus roseus]|uniref:NUDIX hydrolase n=1 Tax=Geminicoccus roseus TaxID=404900 RepID=UPI000407D805|nr:NUDIX hydrolase [Geminicoccus roseus]